jgi:hypothetical protein
MLYLELLILLLLAVAEQVHLMEATHHLALYLQLAVVVLVAVLQLVLVEQEMLAMLELMLEAAAIQADQWLVMLVAQQLQQEVVLLVEMAG